MKLRERFVVTFLATVFLPIIVTIFALWGIRAFQVGSIEDMYGLNGSEDVDGERSAQDIGRLTLEIYDSLKEKLEEDTRVMEDIAYLDKVNEALSYKYSYLIVCKGGEIVYSGKASGTEGIYDELPEYGNLQITGTYFKDANAFLKQIDFLYPDNTEGSAYIVTRIYDISSQVQSMVREAFIVIVIILLMTSISLTWWNYKEIAGPIKKLSEAAKKIKEGDLDFALQSESDDEIGHLCANFEDMRRRLKESEELKNQYDDEHHILISNISHDLKTPITAIKGYVEGIMDGVANTPEKQAKYIRTIYNKANDMDRLVNELTVYSSFDNNRIPYNYNKVRVSDYFDDCVEEISVELDSKNIQLQYSNHLKDDVIVIADVDRLKRVINNIISNSVKYIDHDHGSIHIIVDDAGDFIQVEISDNGRGIASKDLPNIFDQMLPEIQSREGAALACLL